MRNRNREELRLNYGVLTDKSCCQDRRTPKQDFLATSHSVTSTVRNAQQFRAFIRASRNRSTLFFVLAREIGLMESMRIIKAVFRTILLSKVTSIATERFSSTAPVKYGPYAVKFTIAPAEGTAQAATVPHPTTDFLRDELGRRLQRGNLIFDFLSSFLLTKPARLLRTLQFLGRSTMLRF